jgi:hypothetical protein
MPNYTIPTNCGRAVVTAKNKGEAWRMALVYSPLRKLTMDPAAVARTHDPATLTINLAFYGMEV